MAQILFILLSLQNCLGNFANAQPAPPASVQHAIATSDLQLLNSKFSPIKSLAEIHRQHFMRLYYYPSLYPGQYIKTSLETYYATLSMIPNSQSFSFDQLLEATNLFLKFTDENNRLTIIVDNRRGPNNLFSSMTQYALGLLYSLEQVGSKDLSRSSDVSHLKSLILRSISGYFRTGGGSSMNKWELIYFYIVYAYHSEFDADIVEMLVGSLASVLRQTNLVTVDFRPANELLLEITLICGTKCKQPPFKLYSGGTRTLVDYQKNIYQTCHNLYLDGVSINLRSSGFYRQYFELLKSSRDPTYEDLRNELVYEDIFDYFFSIWESIKYIFREDSPAAYFQQALDSFWTLCKLLVGAALFLLPMWQIILTIAILLLIFFGNQKISWMYPVAERPLSIRKIVSNSYRFVGWAVAKPFNLVVVSFKNLHYALVESNRFSDKLAVNLISIALTLAIAEVSQFLDSMYY